MGCRRSVWERKAGGMCEGEDRLTGGGIDFAGGGLEIGDWGLGLVEEGPTIRYQSQQQ